MLCSIYLDKDGLYVDVVFDFDIRDLVVLEGGARGCHVFYMVIGLYISATIYSEALYQPLWT